MQSSVTLRSVSVTAAVLCRASRQKGHHRPHSNRERRQFAVYAIGEGWTGALGQQFAQQVILGHHDEEETDVPVLIYPDPVQSASAGWGCTSIVTKKDGKLLVIGRPQDFISLLRLNRSPRWVRQWSSYATTTTGDSSDTTIVGSMISKVIGWATGTDDSDKWQIARQQSYLPDWTPLTVPNEKSVLHVVSNAGFSAVVGASGTLYTFGINSRGQCGIGSVSNNVWTPQSVVGLNTATQKGGAGGGGKGEPPSMEQESPIVDVSLGLQHGLAVSNSGVAYSWGKAGRGQLGREVELDQDSQARPIILTKTPGGVAAVSQISAGMHHGALLTADNRVWVWGKHSGPGEEVEEGRGDDSNDDDKSTIRTWADLRVPRVLGGLPPLLKVEKISCGSHHTAILLEDGSVYACGVAADISVPILDAVQLVPPGSLDMPCRQFEAHHDRTTIVGRDGRQVVQVHLWNEEGLKDYAMFTPPWVELLLEKQESIVSVHRGWLHTVIVTADGKN
jgi:alpha-tubulin suppressor-like RCC1 family protein